MVQVKVTRQDTHLEHKAFKYLKKKKVNGKWRYYYDTDALKSELNDYKKALSSEDEREAYMKATNAERDNSKKTARKRKEEDERAAKNTEMFKKKYEEADATTKNQWKTWSSEATKTKKKYEETFTKSIRLIGVTVSSIKEEKLEQLKLF